MIIKLSSEHLLVLELRPLSLWSPDRALYVVQDVILKEYNVLCSRKIGRELNLAVWRSVFATAKLKSANFSYLHTYLWQSLTKPPNLIPANISSYMVMVTFTVTSQRA